MKNFKEYLAKGIARKVSQNKPRAYSLIEDSEKRENFLNRAIKNINLSNDNANYFIEEVYDILISITRAKMFIDGFEASGNNAHEAEVSYLKEIKFLDFEINLMNEIRRFRNGIKYYGKRYTKEEAEKIIDFMNSLLPKLKKLVNS